MANKTFMLAKTLLKNGEWFGVNVVKNKTARVMLIVLLLLIVPGFFAGNLMFLVNAYNVLSSIGQEGVIISWGIAINSATIFIFGIFYVISSFYFANDIEILLSMPLKPRHIVGAKFLVIALYEYIITAVIFLPIMLVYGIKSGAFIHYYLYGFIVFIFIPVVPLVLATVINFILMRFVNISKRKDALKIVAGIFAMALGLGLNALIQRFSTGVALGSLEEMLTKGNSSLALITSGIFPTAGLAVNAMVNSNELSSVLYILVFALISILAYIILLYAAELLYFKGVTGLSESGSRRKKTIPSSGLALYKRRSVLWTYTINELRILVRTPIYFLNCVLINFIWPLLLLFPLLAQTIDSAYFESISDVLTSNRYSGAIIIGGFSMALFLGGTNGIASTSISREGQELFVKKYIPINYTVQITAKVLPAFIFGAVGVIVMIAFAMVLFKLPVYIGLLIFLTSCIAIVLTALIGVLIDLYNPKLNWDSEHKAVKQNLNVVYSMTVSAVLAGLNIYAAIKLLPTVFHGITYLVTVYGLLIVIVYYIIRKNGVKRFIELEV